MCAFVPSRETPETVLCSSRDDVHLNSERQFILAVCLVPFSTRLNSHQAVPLKNMNIGNLMKHHIAILRKPEVFFFDLIVSTTKTKLLT
jgi:hypothetical protein